MRRLLVTVVLGGLAVLGGAATAAPHVQNNDWNVHILAYGPAAAAGKVRGQLKAGQKLSRVFVRCDRDLTLSAHHPVRAADPPNLAPRRRRSGERHVLDLGPGNVRDRRCTSVEGRRSQDRRAAERRG